MRERKLSLHVKLKAEGFSQKYMAKENGKCRHPLRFSFCLHSMVKIAKYVKMNEC